MMYIVVSDISMDPTVSYGGPWWLVQIWLNAYTTIVADRPSLSVSSFPSDYAENEDPSTHRCMSFGDVVSAYPGSNPLADLFKEWFS